MHNIFSNCIFFFICRLFTCKPVEKAVLLELVLCSGGACRQQVGVLGVT